MNIHGALDVVECQTDAGGDVSTVYECNGGAGLKHLRVGKNGELLRFKTHGSVITVAGAAHDDIACEIYGFARIRANSGIGSCLDLRFIDRKRDQTGLDAHHAAVFIVLGVGGKDAPLGGAVGLELSERNVRAGEVGRFAGNLRAQSFRLGMTRSEVAHGRYNGQNADSKAGSDAVAQIDLHERSPST